MHFCELNLSKPNGYSIFTNSKRSHTRLSMVSFVKFFTVFDKNDVRGLGT